jgi:hypothetical protein
MPAADHFANLESNLKKYGLVHGIVLAYEQVPATEREQFIALLTAVAAKKPHGEIAEVLEIYTGLLKAPPNA